MKIASHLWQSPLGVFYFRETEQKNGRQSSRRISLRTKDPVQAKCKAVQLLATLASNNSAMSKLDKFEIAVSNGNLSVKTDPDKPDDIIHLGKFLTEHKDTLKELVAAQGMVQPQAQITAPAHHSAQYSAAYASLIPKYEERKKKEIAKKTLYQYTQIIKKFQEWAEGRGGYKPLLMNQIDKKLVSIYVDYLQANGFSNQNIENKYMRALNTFFDYAISTGEFPDIPSPSRGHKLKTSKKERIAKIDREPFTSDDLKKIFHPDNLLALEHPDSYWLPILALFTGARMNELCQLTTIDISEEDGIPAIQITDENEGSLKSAAAKRKIPIHPELVKIGFLKYVADIKKFGYKVFPNLQPDTFGSYIKEPSRRFGAYLDKLGIVERSKVFHSFRSTANNVLKDNGVTLEERCELVGHEVDLALISENVNREHYSRKFKVKYLFDNVIPKLKYDLDLSGITYQSGMFDKFIAKRIGLIARRKKEKKHQGIKDA